MSTTRTIATSTMQHVEHQRILTVVSAAVAAVVVWVIARYGTGINLHTPAFSATGTPSNLNAGFVIVTAVVVSALAWALLEILERRVSRPRRVWTVIAVVVLLLSFSMPLSGHGITRSNEIALICMHLAVGVTLIFLLGRTARTRQASTQDRPSVP